MLSTVQIDRVGAEMALGIGFQVKPYLTACRSYLPAMSVIARARTREFAIPAFIVCFRVQALHVSCDTDH